MPRHDNIEALQQASTRFKLRDLDGYCKLYDNAVIHHGFSSRIRPGVAGLRTHYEALLKGFPEMRIDIEDIIADGEKVAHRCTFTGTHSGEFLGLAPTGKVVRAPAVHIHLFKDARAVEVWQVFDSLTFLLEIGAVTKTASKK
jgi:predicted ester cyclase